MLTFKRIVIEVALKIGAEWQSRFVNDFILKTQSILWLLISNAATLWKLMISWPLS